MMFGGGDDRKGFEKNMALDVLLNGLEKEGLTGPCKGKHMHRIMVLYEEFLGQFCDEPAMDDADGLAAAEERVRALRNLLRDTQELSRMQEELQGSEARRLELAREEAEREARDVKEELRGIREELRESREALRDAEEELEEAKKKGRGAEKELEGVKKEMMEAEEKERKEWKEIAIQLEEINRKLQYGFEEAGENGEGALDESKMANEKGLRGLEETRESSRAKAALVWASSLLALALALVWIYI